MVYKKKSKEEVKQEVDTLLDNAQKQIEKYFKTPEQIKELMDYMSNFYRYSFGNTVLIESQFMGARAVGSYAFWKDKGFQVNKGEKGIKILVPTKLGDRFKNEKGEITLVSKANNREKELIKSGKLEMLKGVTVFKQGYVFDISQTNAKVDDLPKIFPNKWLEGEVKDYKALYKGMEKIAKSINVKIIEPKSELGAAKGCSYPLTKEVALNPRNSDLQNVKTLIHELAHAKLHTMETRNNYSTEAKEFQAELTAYVVSKHFNLDTSEYSFGYVSEWTKDKTLDDKEQLLKEIKVTSKEYIEVIENTLNELKIEVGDIVKVDKGEIGVITNKLDGDKLEFNKLLDKKKDITTHELKGYNKDLYVDLGKSYSVDKNNISGKVGELKKNDIEVVSSRKILFQEQKLSDPSLRDLDIEKAETKSLGISIEQ